MNGPSRPSPCANTFGSVYSGRRLMNQLRNFWNRDEDSGTNRAILQVCLTHRHSQTYRDTDTHTHSLVMCPHRQAHRHTGRQTDKYTGKQTHRQTHADRHTDKQADTHSLVMCPHRQAHRQTGRHIQKSGFSFSTTVWLATSVWRQANQPVNEKRAQLTTLHPGHYMPNHTSNRSFFLIGKCWLWLT